MTVWHIRAANTGASYGLPDQEADDEGQALVQAKHESNRKGDVLFGLVMRAYPCQPGQCGAYSEHRGQRSRP